MDYQKEYINKNPGLHDSDAKSKINLINHILLPIHSKFDSIVDVACGSGTVLLEISKRYHSRKNLGIDISEKMIEVAKNNDFERKVMWITSDTYKLKINNYELILAIDIVEHTKDDLRFLNHIKQFGKFIVIKVPIEINFINKLVKTFSFGRIDECKHTKEKYGHLNHYSEKDIMYLIKKAGLCIISKQYSHLPKRSMGFWEVIRIALFPLWYISKVLYLRINGGFLVLLVKKHE